MLIDYRTGIRREVPDHIGQTLCDRNIARPAYATRDMSVIPVSSQPTLDDLTADELRSIARKRGIKVHHKAGVIKLLAAIRAAA